MTYNAQNAEEVSGSGLPPDTILDGVIIDITEGVTKNFIPVSSIENWKGDVNNPAINVAVEIKTGEETKTIHQMFTFKKGENGKTLFTTGSNLSKYKSKYGKLPEAGDQVKVATNNEGFGKVKLD